MQNKEFNHYFPSAGRWSATSRKAGLYHATWLLGKTNTTSPNISAFLLLSQSFYGWAWHPVVWGIPLASWGQLPQLCLLPASHPPPACLWVGRFEEGKGCVLCEHCSAHVTNTVLVSNSKHSTMQAWLYVRVWGEMVCWFPCIWLPCIDFRVIGLLVLGLHQSSLLGGGFFQRCQAKQIFW